jgi:hypothetical protein
MDSQTEELKQIIKDLKEDKIKMKQHIKDLREDKIKMKQHIKDLRDDNIKMKQELKELKKKNNPPRKPPSFNTKLYILSSDLYEFIEKNMNQKMRRTEIDPVTGFEKTRTFQYMDIIKFIIDYTKNHFIKEDSLLKSSLKYDPDLYSLMKIDKTEKITFGKQSYIFKKLEENAHIVSVEYF